MQDDGWPEWPDGPMTDVATEHRDYRIVCDPNAAEEVIFYFSHAQRAFDREAEIWPEGATHGRIGGHPVSFMRLQHFHPVARVWETIDNKAAK